MFVQTQTLEYREHKDELEMISRVLDLLNLRDVGGAVEILVARHDRLIADQTPTVKSFDPRVARV